LWKILNGANPSERLKKKLERTLFFAELKQNWSANFFFVLSHNLLKSTNLFFDRVGAERKGEIVFCFYCLLSKNNRSWKKTGCEVIWVAKLDHGFSPRLGEFGSKMHTRGGGGGPPITPKKQYKKF
jgi:hypothetical protein